MIDRVECPSCGKAVAETAWICGFCDHILDPSVLGLGEEASPLEERTSAWHPASVLDEVPDAVILGEPKEEEIDPSVVRGAAARERDGRTASFVFYATSSTSRTIRPDAIPRIDRADRGARTPYESFVLSQIDGVRSVREIHRASRLAPQEIVVTLLTLLDRGAIRIDDARRPALGELSGDTETTEAMPSPALRQHIAPSDELPTPKEEKPPPLLNPSFLVEVPPSDVARKPKRAAGALRTKPQRIATINVAKAQLLFNQALQDKADGNLVSARMNMKLALTFDPTNELYARAFDELSKSPEVRSDANSPTGRSRARELHDRATEAESSGDVDRAIALLEQAIACSREPPFLNRLGVILAMRKRDFSRAAELVEQALEVSSDPTYARNLEKIRSMAASFGSGRRPPRP